MSRVRKTTRARKTTRVQKTTRLGQQESGRQQDSDNKSPEDNKARKTTRVKKHTFFSNKRRREVRENLSLLAPWLPTRRGTISNHWEIKQVGGGILQQILQAHIPLTYTPPPPPPLSAHPAEEKMAQHGEIKQVGGRTLHKLLLVHTPPPLTPLWSGIKWRTNQEVLSSRFSWDKFSWALQLSFGSVSEPLLSSDHNQDQDQG